MKRIIDPKQIATKDLHQYIIGSIAPRPIAFVSTKDENGIDNLAPYSFFNAFSSNPPIAVFSSNRKVSDNNTKDTLHNVRVTGEVVINVVNHAIVRQMSLASVEFPRGVSEFVKTGLTPMPCIDINASLVQESPVNMECKVIDIVTLGEHGGAGHLIICEILKIHLSEDILEGDRIDPDKIDLMGRMGRSYYVRASGPAVQSIYQSVVDDVLGFDQLPDFMKKSHFLTGNELSILAACKNIPDTSHLALPLLNNANEVFDAAKKLLAIEDGDGALQLLMYYHHNGLI